MEMRPVVLVRLVTQALVVESLGRTPRDISRVPGEVG